MQEMALFNRCNFHSISIKHFHVFSVLSANYFVSLFLFLILQEKQMFSLEVTDRADHLIALKWSLTDTLAFDVYKLEMRYGLNDWKTVYWGNKSHATIRHLEANLCFTFQVVALKLNHNAYEVVSTSSTVSVCTLPDTSLTTFHRTVQKRQMHAFKQCVQNFPEFINMPGRCGITAIGFGVIHNNDDAVRFLLENGAHVNVGVTEVGRTPFMLAIARTNMKLARALLEKRPNLNLQDLNQMSAAHFAIDTDQLEMIKFCVEHGSNLELRDNCGWTLILRAIVMKCKMEIIEYLIEKGVDLSVIDRFKLGCMEHAKLQERNELIEELQKHTIIKLEPTSLFE